MELERGHLSHKRGESFFSDVWTVEDGNSKKCPEGPEKILDFSRLQNAFFFGIFAANKKKNRLAAEGGKMDQSGCRRRPESG